MTKKMRIKDVGATINLGNYSSLHVTIGEASEFAGLSLDRATTYLMEIAKKVDGVLNLPEKTIPKKPKVSKKTEDSESDNSKSLGEKLYCFGTSTPMWYDNDTHSYIDEKGVRYESVTQVLSTFYPFNSKGVINQEYLDFASSFGNLIHTAIQNAVIGKPPKKELVGDIVEKAREAIGSYDLAWVEQVIALPEQQIAGRFDILTKSKGKYTLWDVKTNSKLSLSVECSLPDPLREEYSKYWAPETTFGEHCLQLNLYAYIIEKTTDVVIDKLKIIHVPDGFETVLPVPKIDISSLLSAYGASR